MKSVGVASNLSTVRFILLSMARSMGQEQDILKMPPPRRPPKLTSRRVGIHTSSSGGVENAAERAYRLGCNKPEIFFSSPPPGAPYGLGRPPSDTMKRPRGNY